MRKRGQVHNWINRRDPRRRSYRLLRFAARDSPSPRVMHDNIRDGLPATVPVTFLSSPCSRDRLLIIGRGLFRGRGLHRYALPDPSIHAKQSNRIAHPVESFISNVT